MTLYEKLMDLAHQRTTDTSHLDLEAPNAPAILRACVDLAEFLIAKNKAYGDSAINPLRVMSKADAAEQIRVRMDDKLSRMMRGQSAGEDAPKDFVGYWILLQVVERRRVLEAQADRPLDAQLVGAVGFELVEGRPELLRDKATKRLVNWQEFGRGRSLWTYEMLRQHFDKETLKLADEEEELGPHNATC